MLAVGFDPPRVQARNPDDLADGVRERVRQGRRVAGVDQHRLVFAARNRRGPGDGCLQRVDSVSLGRLVELDGEDVLVYHAVVRDAEGKEVYSSPCRAAQVTASTGVSTSIRSHMCRIRQRKVRSLTPSWRAAASAVAPVASTVSTCTLIARSGASVTPTVERGEHGRSRAECREYAR